MNKDPLHFKCYGQALKLVYLMLYMILHYLNFFKNVPTLISYTPLNALTLNPNNEINVIVTSHIAWIWE
jgi:hypothetical protein